VAKQAGKNRYRLFDTAKNNEIALRRALGANQQAIFNQCLIETIILGCTGSLIGSA
jgi:putative ABC transport system permease protein